MELSEKKFLKLLIVLGAVFMPFIIYAKTGSVGGSLKLVSFPLILFLPTAWLVIRFQLHEMSAFDKKYSKIIGYALICVFMLLANKIPDRFQLYLVLFALYGLSLVYYLKFVRKD